MTRHTAAALLAIGTLVLAGCASEDPPAASADADAATAAMSTATGTSTPVAVAQMQDADGSQLGTVTFAETSDGVEVVAEVQDLEEGFYGFHVHGVGLCEPESAAPDDPEQTGAFLSAGGHLGADAGEHPDHAGDLPSLLVTSSGTGHLSFVTDRLTAQDLLDDDGSAVMIHGGHDNFANIPERYAVEGPDEGTLRTGDAGDRLACGVAEGTGG